MTVTLAWLVVWFPPWPSKIKLYAHMAPGGDKSSHQMVCVVNANLHWNRSYTWKTWTVVNVLTFTATVDQCRCNAASALVRGRISTLLVLSKIQLLHSVPFIGDGEWEQDRKSEKEDYGFDRQKETVLKEKKHLRANVNEQLHFWKVKVILKEEKEKPWLWLLWYNSEDGKNVWMSDDKQDEEVFRKRDIKLPMSKSPFFS